MKLLFMKDLMIYAPFVVAVSIFSKYSLVYIPFLIIIARDIFMVIKKRENIEQMMFRNLVYSVMLPDNFSVIFFAGLLLLYFMLEVFKKKKIIRVDKGTRNIFILILITFIFNVIIHKMYISNMILYFMYNFVFIVIPVIFLSCSVEEYETIDKSLNTAIVIQGLAIITMPFFNMDVIKNNLFGDWSIGTMGTSQGVQLFSLMIFTAVKLLSQYLKTKRREYLIFFAAAVIMSLTTVTLTNTALFFAAVILYFIMHKFSRKTKLVMIGIISVLLCLFWFGSDVFVREQFTKIVTDSEFRINRVKKLETYEDTFVSLPKKDLKAGLTGVGAGNYSSRAALTASGYYTSWYNSSRFQTNINKYARKYIRPRLFKNIGVSILETPTSQYISIMGEYGYVGIAVFILTVVYVLAKNKSLNRMLIIYFLMTCFFDNYFEYPKIILIMYLCCFIIKKDCDITYKSA